LNEILSKKEQISVVLHKIEESNFGYFVIYDSVKDTIKSTIYNLDIVFNTLIFCKDEIIDTMTTDVFLPSLGKDFETSGQREERYGKSRKQREELNIGSRERSVRREKIGGTKSKTRKHK